METVLTIENKDKTGQLVHDLIGILNRWDGKRPLRFTAKEIRKKRSLNQNDLYWKWVDIIANHVGDGKDDVHYDLGCKYLPVTQSAINKRPIPKSTTELDTKEMFEYMEKVDSLATQLGIMLPTPEEALNNSLTQGYYR